MDLAKNAAAIRGSFCIEEIPRQAGFVIFGASGDLTSRKLIPALYNLHRKRLLPRGFFLIGCARSTFTDETFRAGMAEAIRAQAEPSSEASLAGFLERCFYQEGDYLDPQLYAGLAQRLNELDRRFLLEQNHVFYLATPPNLYRPVIEQLGSSGLSRETAGCANAVRIIIEKPFGRDLESAMDLDRALSAVFSERQIYRIDHYLGKETVQNILLLRFANAIFEPIWNRRYIDNVQITVAESVGIEHRAGYFEQAGLLRDMFQNHMLQMLALVAMEPPCSFDADRLRDEKVKLLRAIRPYDPDAVARFIVRGQYRGYLDEKGVAANSRVETFVAAKFLIDNWRWEGVPFYLRAGKRLKRKSSKIVISFKAVPHSMFLPLTPADLAANILTFHVQPEEGISLRIQAKHPGPKLCMDALEMKFRYKEEIGVELPEAYERLLLDCLLGDQTLFIRHDDMQVSWSLITPVLKAWQGDPEFAHTGKLMRYPAGSWGPACSEELLGRDGMSWVRL